MKTVVEATNRERWHEAGVLVRRANKVVALTGAGLSVGSGIADFRSPGGLWSRFSPEEYASIEVFHRDPAKAWELFSAMGKELVGKEPNPAHRALAELEAMGLLAGIITQNIDNLHQRAGSRQVFAMHGDHQHLQCLRCQSLIAVDPQQDRADSVPLCEHCHAPLKPNVVLFGEPVRELPAIEALLAGCDLLLVIGTSAQVYPAAGLPVMVRQGGGCLFEFNLEPALPSFGGGRESAKAHWFFPGDVVRSLPRLVEVCCGR
jgi:NAD-dependent deacetylase